MGLLDGSTNIRRVSLVLIVLIEHLLAERFACALGYRGTTKPASFRLLRLTPGYL